MQLKTILNHVERHKSFVYQEARWADPKAKSELEILIQPRANGRAICSKCGCQASGYDRLPARRFEFVPLWQITVYFVYATSQPLRDVSPIHISVQIHPSEYLDSMGYEPYHRPAENRSVSRVCVGRLTVAERVRISTFDPRPDEFYSSVYFGQSRDTP